MIKDFNPGRPPLRSYTGGLHDANDARVGVLRLFESLAEGGREGALHRPPRSRYELGGASIDQTSGAMERRGAGFAKRAGRLVPAGSTV